MNNKYEKEKGLILNFCEIKIDKITKSINYTYKQYKVLVSNEHQYVVENNYGRLEMLNKLSKYSSGYHTVNKVSVNEQRWDSKYIEDYIYSRCVSTFSEKITKNRIKKALYNFIQKEAYIYSGLQEAIEQKLKEAI